MRNNSICHYRSSSKRWIQNPIWICSMFIYKEWPSNDEDKKTGWFLKRTSRREAYYLRWHICKNFRALSKFDFKFELWRPHAWLFILQTAYCATLEEIGGLNQSRTSINFWNSASGQLASFIGCLGSRKQYCLIIISWLGVARFIFRLNSDILLFFPSYIKKRCPSFSLTI